MFQIKSERIIDKATAKKIVAMGVSLRDSLSKLENKCIEEYDETKTYIKGVYVTYDGYLWQSKVTTTGTFNPDKWTKKADDLTLVELDDIKAMVGLNDEEIDTLSKIILDSEIRLDKTFSSSKIYTDIQGAIDTSKKYTLEQFAKVSKASYRVVTSTTEMTDTSVIYLLQNGANFDMYITEDGTNAKKIGDTNIDLSDYVKITDLDGYLKKTDADGKYALITTVDGKVDKTSILTSISNSPSNDKLLSEKAIKTELDKKIDKTSIVNTIDNTSTDSQIPSALSIYDNIIKDKLGNFGLDYTYSQSDSMNIKLTHFGAYKFANPTKGVPSDNVGDWVLINIPWGLNLESYSTTMRYANQLLFSPRKSNTFWFRRVWNYDESSYTYTEGNYDVFDKWNKINTSTINDVPKTKITLDTSIWTSGDVYYEVKNGICYVSISALTPKNAGANIVISNSMPKPDFYVLATLSIANNKTVPINPIQARIAGDSTILVLHSNNNTEAVFGSFSYPVTES